MGLKASLHQYLAGTAGVTTVVSTRIYRHKAPDSATLPRITYNRISNPHTHHFGGAAGLATARIQLDCWGTTDTEAETVAEATRAALEGFSGTFGTGGNTTTIRSCLLESNADDWTLPTDGSETGVYRVMQEYVIWYVESVPTP